MERKREREREREGGRGREGGRERERQECNGAVWPRERGAVKSDVKREERGNEK